MSDDYLWDKSGEPDPDIERLERALARYRHGARQPPVPMRGGAGQRRRVTPALVGVLGLAAAAAFVVVLGGAALFLRATHPTVEVARLEGSPTIGSRSLEGSGRLSIGERLRTDAVSRARIDVGLIGQVVVEPDSRVALAALGTREQRLSLELGTIRARIWAPPGLFRVDVPSALAVDMGCAYTLSVDPSQAGLLRVTQGWVAFTHEGLESFVPQGALCRTRPGVGPGTPYRDDASAPFVDALAVVDFEPAASAERRRDAFGSLLTAARPRDALTLWHLLSRVSRDERERVFERLAQLVPPPEGVTREGILAGDRRMLDLWWDDLGLNTASFWRRWEGTWPLGDRR